jgi:hypothetical protein
MDGDVTSAVYEGRQKRVNRDGLVLERLLQMVARVNSDAWCRQSLPQSYTVPAKGTAELRK